MAPSFCRVWGSLLLVSAAGTLLLAGCGVSSSAPTTTRATRTSTTTTSTTTVPISSLRRCSTSQLRVNVFGASGAAGTGLTGIGIANTSTTPCWLQGVPTVDFFGRAKSGARTRLAVNLSYEGPAVLFPRQPVGVILLHEEPVRSTLGRYPAISAGFIITSRDFGSGVDDTPCTTVTAISVRLPGLAGADELSMKVVSPSGVPIWSYHICDLPPPVSVSAVVTRLAMFESVGEGIVSTSTAACQQLSLGEGASVTLLSQTGRAILFSYTHEHNQFMTSSPPRRVVLAPGVRAFVLLVTYDCMVGGEGRKVAEVRLVPPGRPSC
ncbi:MAG: DUF4232 domain-containing protein [Acidimicrobiales bacterium]